MVGWLRSAVWMSLSLSARVHAADKAPDFIRDVRPILANRCFACHGADEGSREAELRLDQRDSSVKPRPTGRPAIKEGVPADSELIHRIQSTEKDHRMPPASVGPPLSQIEIDVLKRWIAAGAPYAKHWAFQPPLRPLSPASSTIGHTADAEFEKNPIDGFVLEAIRRAGLTPSPEAERAVLARRVSLDLVGLPPSSEAVASFVADSSPDAYERYVDRLLASPAYGERWARVWLDLARYADSAGYGSDPLRTIWRYREWTIDAFNDNMPYDLFTEKQLAGDLRPNATFDDRLATAFHRNTMTNTEGGTDDEEFRIAAIKDRVDVTLQVWMGLTAGCAKCHSHKFDPISHEEYYKLFAFFNQTADNDQPGEQPTMASPGRDFRREDQEHKRMIAELRKRAAEPRPELAAAEAAWIASMSSPSAWEALRPKSTALSESASKSPPKVSIAANGLLHIQGPPAASSKLETYTIEMAAEVPVAAVRLETMPSSVHPTRGAGRGTDGNFVLTAVTVEVQDARTQGRNPQGRFVRIELPGKQRLLHLAEVQVVSRNVNQAAGKKASQSSTDFHGEPSRAVDGQTDGDYYRSNSTSHTKQEDNPWWEVDLGATTRIDRVTVWNRTDGDTAARLHGYRLVVLDDARKVVWTVSPKPVPMPSASFNPDGWNTVEIVGAVADHEQAAFPAAAVLDGFPTTGWAVAPKIDQPHELLLALERPIAAGQVFRVRLEHGFQPHLYALGSFRISATSDPRATERVKQPTEIRRVLATQADRRSIADRQRLASYYREAVADSPVDREIAKLEKKRPKPPTTPILQELPTNQKRKTFLLEKGNFLTPGTTVEAGTPSAFHAWIGEEPVNRLGLSRWLTARDNPLAARVAVNRLWSRLFGRGIVETEEDFGTQGELPSHPELLDWLATEYVRLGWDQKAILRTIVLSAAYRQSSVTRPEHLERDPSNRLLARFPRQRLEAEMVRDSALSVSGLLAMKLGGPSVFPPQPAGLWQAAFNGERTWSTSNGPDRYRRGLYVFWRRTVPYPSMAAFDAPSRETCTMRRKNTNTPLQAFVTLNDPVYLEASQALARKIIRQEKSDAARADYGLKLCLSRDPRPEETAALLQLIERATEEFRGDPKRAAVFTNSLSGAVPGEETKADVVERAAWTLAANILLNLDGFLTKG